MIEKYIRFFKRSLVVLSILLFVICFSFGFTYSSFVYNSDSYRAVEMFTSELKYDLSETKLAVKPGNNIFKIDIKSLNDIDTYYKVVYDNNHVNVKFFDNESNVIRANGTNEVYLVIFNSGNEKVEVKVSVLGGFTTNKYEDIKVNKGYAVTDNIQVGKQVTINNYSFNLLNINEDGSYELLSNAMDDNLNIEGSNGYNQYLNIISDSVNNIEGSFSKRVVSVLDIEKYTKNKIMEYGASHYYSDTYYPALWSLEEYSIINNEQQESFYNKSEGTISGIYEHSSSITLRDNVINTPEFINNKYKDLFMNGDYLIATRYQKANKDNATWGVLSIENKVIKQNELFDSNIKDYSVNGKVRIIINISSGIDLLK